MNYFFFLLIALQALSQTADPFWKKKEIQTQMIRDRKIVVSATREDSQWHFKGAGMVRRSLQDCLQEALNFNRLKEIPERFPVVEYEAAQKQWHLQVVFLGQNKDLQVRVEPDEKAQKIHFSVVEGWQKGLQGDLVFSDYGRQLTEVGVFATAERSPSWIPDFIFSTAAEAVMHHVSLSLRNGLEKDYKN